MCTALDASRHRALIQGTASGHFIFVKLSHSEAPIAKPPGLSNEGEMSQKAQASKTH